MNAQEQVRAFFRSFGLAGEPLEARVKNTLSLQDAQTSSSAVDVCARLTADWFARVLNLQQEPWSVALAKGRAAFFLSGMATEYPEALLKEDLPPWCQERLIRAVPHGVPPVNRGWMHEQPLGPAPVVKAVSRFLLPFPAPGEGDSEAMP